MFISSYQKSDASYQMAETGYQMLPDTRGRKPDGNAIVKGLKVCMIGERRKRIQQEQQVDFRKSTSGFGVQQVGKTRQQVEKGSITSGIWKLQKVEKVI